MEMKWFMVGVAFIAISASISVSLDSKFKADCGAAYANSTKSGSEIAEICGTKQQGSITITDKNAR